MENYTQKTCWRIRPTWALAPNYLMGNDHWDRKNSEHDPLETIIGIVKARNMTTAEHSRIQIEIEIESRH